MKNGALKTHLSQVLYKYANRQPQMARLVFRSGVFMVIAKSEQKIEDKIVRFISPGECAIGFREDIWEGITYAAKLILEDYTREQTAKNADK